MDALIINSLLN